MTSNYRVEELWDEVTNDDGDGADNPDYEVVVETVQGTEHVLQIRWEHSTKRMVIELE